MKTIRAIIATTIITTTGTRSRRKGG